MTRSLLGTLTPLVDDDRTAFRSRFSEARCERTGGETRSKGVLGDGTRWAPLMAKAVALGSDALLYDETRLAFFLECLLSLHAAREVERRRRGGATTNTVALELARATAAAARKALLDSLEAIACANEVDGPALDDVRGTMADDDATVRSLGSLADYADAWLAKKDGISKRLVASAKLVPAKVAAARDAAAKLAAAAAAATMGGVVGAERDTPAINRIEGRVLEEMRVAMNAFAAAVDVDERIPRLNPGPATRRVLLGRSASTRLAGDGSGDGAPANAPGGASPAAPGGGAAPALVGPAKAARRKRPAKKRRRG